MNDDNNGVTVTLLSPAKMVCPVCSGKLRSLARDEISRIKMRHALPRGLYICEECRELATISYTLKDIENPEWAEFIEKVRESDVLTDKDAINKTMSSIASMPEGTIRTVSWGKLFQCEGKGVSCDRYTYASCGLGNPHFCPGGKCSFDPYPEEYKKLHWYRQKGSSWSKNQTDIVLYWTEIIQIARSLSKETLIDAIKRIGTIPTVGVSELLLGLAHPSQEDLEVKLAAVEALAKQNACEQIQHIFHCCLDFGQDEKLQLLTLRILRDAQWTADVKTAEQVAYLTNRESLRQEAAKTLRHLEKRASVLRPDFLRK